MNRIVIAALLVTAGCAEPPSSGPVRLVDRFAEARVEGTPAASIATYAPTQWRFSDGATIWRAAQNIQELRIEDGAMRGRSTSDQPVLVAERLGDVPASEILYGVEVRARTSAGTQLSVRFDGGQELNLPRALGSPLGALTTPIGAGDDMQTFFIRATSALSPAGLTHVILLPTNEAGAYFEVESVRLVFRGEHLRSVDSGVGWHGMSEVYRETLVTRSPEVVHYELELPAEPALEFAVGTTQAGPVTFRVEVGGYVLEEVVSEPDVWHAASLDLEGLGGEQVEMTLAIEAEERGALGFWGAPVVRSNVVSPAAPQVVVLIITDTLRADHLDLYGYDRETTPTLTRLAGEGAFFADTISQSTWTKVSVPAIQTSLYPTTHTIADIPDRLPASATTIAEVYRSAGFATLALTSIPFVGQLTNLHQGYEELHESGSIPGGGMKTASRLVDRLLPWLEAHRHSRVFALLHVADPHSPYRPEAAYEEAFGEAGEMDRLDELTERVMPHIRSPLSRLFRLPARDELVAGGIDPEEFTGLERNGYDGSILGMDDALALVFDKLDELELSERALVAVVSDHGTEFLEHDQHFHGHTVYGEANRVPMLIWGPSYVPAGQRIDATVQTIDLMPTMLEMSGLPVPAGAQGASLVSILESGSAVNWNRPAITELPANMRGIPRRTALIADGWKLVLLEDPAGEPRLELYDHKEDPLNLNDVSAEHPDIVERLSALHDNWQRRAQVAQLDDADATLQQDAEELERLRSLGYIR